MDELLQEFIAETRETLEAIAGEIVAWEADPTDRARLDAIFRFVHTVKGSCGFLDLPRLARLSHAAEDVLGAVRGGVRAPDTALVNAVLAVVDRIGELVEAIDSGQSVDDTHDDLLIAAMAQDAAPAVVASVVAGGARVVARSVRLHVDLLDRMMGGMSDMVLARNELARTLRDGPHDARVEAALERLSLTVADMRDAVTRTRMQKVDALFSAVPRMVRDTAAELGKTVALTVDGADVELDREMIELIRDPLVHIIRNAVDHGLESPAERREAGKREACRLSVSARQSGNQILIEVADDGRGIDVARVVAKALATGLRTARELDALSESQRLDLIFEPGLSSRDEVSAVSGRGVGMDIVRANIEQLGGRVVLANRRGQGLAITIHVPLTLSILSTIVVDAGGERFAIPRQSVEEIVTINGDSVRLDHVGDAALASVRGRRLPIVSLAGLMGLPDSLPSTLAIIATREGEYALAIHKVIDAEELVVKPAAPAVMATGFYAGQTLPDSGRPMLLLDGGGLAAAAGVRFGRPAARDAVEVEAEVPGTAALLFEGLDGRRRLVALAAIDRVEKVRADAIRRSGGRLRLSIDGQIVPLVMSGELDGHGSIAVLRLNDGMSEIGYGIADAIEIVTLPADLSPGDGAEVAGVALIAGEQIELIDAHALFAGGGRSLAERPLCHLGGDDSGWMEAFLKPALEGAGYRCKTVLAPGDEPAVTLAMADAPPSVAMEGHVVRLTREPGGAGGIYRYDRVALLAAMADRVAQGSR